MLFILFPKNSLFTGEQSKRLGGPVGVIRPGPGHHQRLPGPQTDIFTVSSGLHQRLPGPQTAI